MMFIELPEQFQDSTGNVFIWYYTGGAHCCGGIAVLRPDDEGMKIIVGQDYFTNEYSNALCLDADGGEAPFLIPNEDGEFYIATQWNDYEPAYVSGTVTHYLWVWNPDALTYEPFDGSAVETCQIITEYMEWPGYFVWPGVFQECDDVPEVLDD